MEPLLIAFRLGITFLFAFLFGLEREWSHKPVGFGTFTFVASGACALATTAISFQAENPLPLLGSIVTGIGFLGAGALIKTSDKITGFTTAASLWLFAIFGLMIGIGNYLSGFLLYLTVWCVLLFDRSFKKRGIGSYQRKVVIRTNRVLDIKTIEEALHFRKRKRLDLDVNKKDKKMVLTYLVEGSKAEISRMPLDLYNQPWFESMKIE